MVSQTFYHVYKALSLAKHQEFITLVSACSLVVIIMKGFCNYLVIIMTNTLMHGLH